MTTELQTKAPEQLSLLGWRPEAPGHVGNVTEAFEEQQMATASERKRALAQGLMEQVADRRNIWRAYKRVKANKGSAGVDGMDVDELLDWLKIHYPELQESLLNGTYRPQPVLGVKIPKPSGGVRQLGIPTALDRLVQQAILQILSPLWEPMFSESSFGFRPGRSAHDAIEQACAYVAEERTIVVDFDLEKFFDRVNHDILMSRLARRIGDRRLLKIIRRFLQAGMMSDGVVNERHQGTPQGGPLSPLLSNILLDELDKELESRGHCFVRYADDCNVYVRSVKAGERVMESVTRFLDQRLRLRVNPSKSAVAHVRTRKFLGYRLLPGGNAGIAPESQRRCKKRLRQLTKRNRGVAMAQVVREVNNFLTGWVTYFHKARARKMLKELGGWLRARLRCYRIRQLKRNFTIYRFLCRHGVRSPLAWSAVLRTKGWWKRAQSLAAKKAMPTAWFTELGLIDPYQRFLALQD